MAPLGSPPFVASSLRTIGCSHIGRRLLYTVAAVHRLFPTGRLAFYLFLGKCSPGPASLSALLPSAGQSAVNDK